MIPRSILAFALLLAGASTFAANTVIGTVKDRSTGNPLAGAVVRLIETGGLDTTDAQGRFAIAIPTTGMTSRMRLAAPRYVAGQGVLFSLERTQKVRVEIVDLVGRIVAVPFDAQAAQGTWMAPVGNLKGGVYLCRISTEQGSRSLRFVQALSTSGTTDGVRRAGGALAGRLTAASEHLATNCAGYAPDTTAWDGTSDSVRILLDPSGAGRSVTSFDAGWLFNNGDAAGADKTAFSDGGWRKVDVPFDWSIEGPYSQTANTGDYGGYLPSGIGWFRKHFTLPATALGKRVFLEFDGVMANSSVYLNGKLLGTRPSGYVGFRYEITGVANFGTTENVVSVKADNSLQMASRWYAGAGIYRHVRLIVTDPVHFDKWATFVTTPTTSGAHVSTTVVNQGTVARTVSVQATLVDPGGTRLSPVSSAAKSIPAGGSADFSLDIPVANAKPWSPDAPNLYRLDASVIADGSALDEEKTTFGIRTIKYDAATGFYLNGKNMKMKGVCLHHDLGGLGAATPLRAWQRRLAVLKTLGVNAIRTSHNHFDPQVLDLMDRMGFLVMDEFFDVWTGHKYGMAGDYATYFKQWYQTDLTDIVKMDRNHPGIVIYSIGNEIRDALATRLPYTKAMISMCHALDSTRPVTQALFQPKTAGDYPGAGGTIDLFDVFGVNYRNAELLEAITGASVPKPGISTEMGQKPGLWTSFYEKTPQVVGEFIWTGAEYMGEAEGSWPTVMGNDGAGTIFGFVDRTSEIKDVGYSFASVWAAKPPTKPKSSTAAVAKLVLTVDHPNLATDFDDIAYVRAAFVDANGTQVSTASDAVTFSLAGAGGAIVAVDNANPASSESYRGNVRKAYKGACYAMVQMKSAGSATVTASSGNLTSNAVTISGKAGAFVPCSGTCD